jgi:hypothetical protein
MAIAQPESTREWRIVAEKFPFFAGFGFGILAYFPDFSAPRFFHDDIYDRGFLKAKRV